MKNLVSILVLVFAFTFTTQAQKKRNHKKPQLSAEQHADLMVKKMTLSLDLSEKQQKQIKPLLTSKIAERKAFMEKRMEAKKEDKKPTADEIYAVKSKMLDNQIAMKNSMKNILNKDQFEKFEKMQKRRKMMVLKKMKERRMDKSNWKKRRKQ
ncbi:hypothetical protein FDT66_10565 [Polaribacter aestuariivivens]|uniref:DUF4890 domain-containing protein n=1 Tax=Polaribacter aestuariivivens TaxID=2304626 RepID=A0A5S3N2V5_9FLAO|nr:hypothetical protein [Polaribacter aestuariivivens]TMM29553.1 hypothetical protein FDT66_10565 [Polaribacter aestuariivivens]